jgi:hypothetical protein
VDLWQPTRRDLLGAALAACGAGAVGVAVRGAGSAPAQPVAAPASDPTAGPRPPGPRALRPEAFGAVGDGVTDDGPALQRALDALEPGQELRLAPEAVYRHDDVVLVRRPGAVVAGPGTLLAGDEERSSLQVQAADVRLTDVRLEIAQTSRRWTGYEQHRLVLGVHAGAVVERVSVIGSAGAGVYVDGASSFVLDDLVVEGTRADGIHMTGGSTDGLVRRPVVRGSGDDGVAVVSYQADRDVVRGITVLDATVLGTTWGRGVSVVGGEDVRYERPRVERTSAAGVYLAVEGDPFFTRDLRRVQVVDAVVEQANHDARVDHGAVLVFAGRDGSVLEDVVVDGATVSGTRVGAARQVGVLADEGAAVRDVVLRRVDIRGRGTALQVTAEQDSVRTEGWVVDGRPVDDPVSA